MQGRHGFDAVPPRPLPHLSVAPTPDEDGARAGSGHRPGLLAFALAVLVVGLALAGGRHGGFVLDDVENLQPVQRWLDGALRGDRVVLGNDSGPLGRPVAMASFVANAAMTGLDSVAFKLVNIALHLANGLLVALLARRLLLRDPATKRNAASGGWLIGAIWLALPIHTSTVLYVVQRMTLLACLFALLAMLTYVAARAALADGRSTRGLAFLWLGVPACAALAALSKESGLLVVPMIGVLEFALYARDERPRAVSSFLLLALALPTAAAFALLATRPELVTAGYATRDFTLAERLLTEPRVLWHYVRAVLLPYSPSMGLIHDDFPKSTGLLQPWTTLPAVLAWLALASVAWRVRFGLPLFACGIGLFLCGHAMESTVFPLELYFEHRNYLPSLGLLFAVAGVIAWLLARWRSRTRAFAIALGVLPFAILLSLAAATSGRARIWGSFDALLEQSLAHSPGSPRLRSMLAVRAMGHGDLTAALAHVDAAARAHPGSDTGRFALWRLLAHCETKVAAPPGAVAALHGHAPGVIPPATMTAYELAATRVESSDRPGIDARAFAAVGEEWVARDPQPDREMPKWRLRYLTARLLAASSDWPAAIATAERAWIDSGYNHGVGVLVFQLNASAGNVARMREVHARLAQHTGRGDYSLDNAVARFGEHLDKATAGATDAGRETLDAR
jgi:protein O-mannosyl-transferase